ncbi:MAG: tetratricopeptide repeat protein, partial [Rubrivivax sp.]|nr:tetratricopeptide repeat protein [Rubrivivax sp.]
DPKQAQAGTALATLYLQTGHAARAARIADNLVKLQPKNAGLLDLQGMARARSGNLAGARAAFEQALAIDARFVAPQINLARLDIDSGAFDAAAKRLAAVLAVNDKDIEALSELGRLNERRGNLTEAQRSLEKADDHSGSANLQTGIALVDFHLRAGQPELARQASKRLLAKAPEALPVLLSLARVNLANADAVAARSNLTRAASLANYNPTVLVQIALLQLAAGHAPGAAHSLGKALSERPDFLAAQALMTEVEIRQGDLAKAEQRARQIIAKHPTRAVGHSLLGDLALARNQGAPAIEAYRRAHQAEPSSQSLLRLHRVLSVQQAPAATQLAEQWVKTHPGDVAVRRVLA